MTIDEFYQGFRGGRLSNDLKSYLTDRRIEGTIGEPWDFESEAGLNVIKGRIVAISDDIEKRQWVLLEILPFNYNGKKICSIFATRRYVKENIIYDLLNGKEACCNFTCDPAGKEFAVDQIDRILEEKKDSHWLSGSFRLIL